LGPAYDGADLLVVEGLGQVVVGTQLERVDSGPLVAVGGHEDEERIGVAGAHLGQELESVHRRHAQIGDDQLRRLPLERRERRGRVLRLAHRVPLALQELDE
jgi:hypothetical protein